MENAAHRRIQHFASTLSTAPQERFLTTQRTAASAAQHVSSDDDVVVVDAVRTAMGKAKRGSFKDTLPSDLLISVLQGLMKRNKMDPKLVQDIVVGTVLPPGGGAADSRMATIVAGFPDTTAVTTVNRQCSSGLQAVANIASAIQSGFIDIGIGAGVESMTMNPMGAAQMGNSINPKYFENEVATSCMLSMGQTSENVAEKFGISRQAQDQMAMESHTKALQAQKEGRFANEIIPVTTIVKDAEGNEKEITVVKDDVPRPTTLEGLAKLRPSFQQDGTTTAGNSSPLTDGAAAVLMMKRRTAKKLGLNVMGTFRSFSVVGVPPDVMGIGPAFAIPEALKKAGLSVDDIDVFEINEAFASQATYCMEKLGIPRAKLNPNGGAIALGHPLGCTGARQVATLLNEMKRTGKRYGVISMCIGTGMGAAAVLELN